MFLFDAARFSLLSLRESRRPRQDPETVARLQDRRLRRLLRYAAAHSPFYRRRYQGLDLERAPLRDLPHVTKPEIMARFDDVVTDRRLRRADLERFVDDPDHNLRRVYLDRYTVSHSSGSQGQPILLVQDRRLLEVLFAFQVTRGNSLSRATPAEALRRLLNPRRVAFVAMKPGFYPTASVFEHLPRAAQLYIKVLRLSQTDADLVVRLNEFQPNVLTAYASILGRLALDAQAGRLRLAPHLKQVVNTSEVLTEQARGRLVQTFGVPVLDNYATGECPFLSNGCPTDPGAHLNADAAILEVVDDAYRPVPPGQPGRRVLITNLLNTVQPFIRYEVEDIVTMATTPCRCGNRLPRIERIEGRTSEEFWIRDGDGHRKVSIKVVKHAFDHVRDVRQWQAVQTNRNRLTVRCEVLPGGRLDETHARRMLARQLGLAGLEGLLHVDLQVVPQLDSDPNTMKFRRCVSLPAPEAKNDAE